MADMYWKKVFVTKELADQWLDANPRNRSKKLVNLDKLKNDLLHGKFELTHQGIAIAEDGELLDGQHRLVAISETGIAAWLWVCFNAPKSTKIDIGASRNNRDSMYMAGVIDKDSTEYCNLTYPLVTFMVQETFGRQKSVVLTADEKHSIYLHHHALIDPIIQIAKRCSSGRGRSSLVLYAMMCALNAGVEKETIEKWLRIVQTGDFYSEDKEELKAGRSILLFKNYIEDRGTLSNGSNEKIEETVKKAMSSIDYFDRKRSVQKIYGSWVYPKVNVIETDFYE